MDCDEGAVSSSTPSVPLSSSGATASAAAASVEEKQPPVPGGGGCSAVVVFGTTETPTSAAAAAAAAGATGLSLSSMGVAPLKTARKSWKRKNAWGNRSYADLIYRAIDSSAEKRLTLAQIYDWLIQNIDYFRQNSDNKSSIGWKNSIRHNLSLHSRFIRIQNDGAGKSSWWTIGPSTPAAHKNLRRKAESSNFPGTGISQRAKVECMRTQSQPRTDASQWTPTTEECMRYYHLTSNPVNAAMVVESGQRSGLGGRSVASPDDHHHPHHRPPQQRQMMFAAAAAHRSAAAAAAALRGGGGYTYVDWRSGLASSSAEPSDWWYPIEYKRCLTEWTSSHGYFLGGGRGGDGEWTVDEAYQKCPEGFLPANDGRMSFGQDPSKGYKDHSSPYDHPLPLPSLPLHPPSPVDSQSSAYLMTSFDNHSYSSHAGTSGSAVPLCVNQQNFIHSSSALASLSPPNPLPPYVAPPYNDDASALYAPQTQGQPCLVPVSCCSAPSALLSAEQTTTDRHRSCFGCPSQALPVHRWTVSHGWQQQQQQQQSAKRLAYCYQDLMPNRVENSPSRLLTQPSFPLDPYMQYYSYGGCDGAPDSSGGGGHPLPLPPPPLCSSVDRRTPDSATEDLELKVFEMGFHDSSQGLCSIEECDVVDGIIGSGSGNGRANGGARCGTGSGGGGADRGVSFDFPFAPILSQVNPAT